MRRLFRLLPFIPFLGIPLSMVFKEEIGVGIIEEEDNNFGRKDITSEGYIVLTWQLFCVFAILLLITINSN